MPILNDAIRSAIKKVGVGYFEGKDFQHSPELSWLISIHIEQVRKWDEKSIVPRQILRVFESWGIVFFDESQKNGMHLDNLLELLWKIYKNHQDNQVSEAALYIFSDTVEAELMPIRWWQKHYN